MVNPSVTSRPLFTSSMTSSVPSTKPTLAPDPRTDPLDTIVIIIIIIIAIITIQKTNPRSIRILKLQFLTRRHARPTRSRGRRSSSTSPGTRSRPFARSWRSVVQSERPDDRPRLPGGQPRVHRPRTAQPGRSRRPRTAIKPTKNRSRCSSLRSRSQ